MLLSLSTSIVSINPIASFVSFPIAGTYSASKTGVHSITQAQRRDCAPIHNMVMGVYPDPIDTDMEEYAPFDKLLPLIVADAVQDALRTIKNNKKKKSMNFLNKTTFIILCKNYTKMYVSSLSFI